MGINNWDIYHLTAGMTRKGKKSELAVGVTYSFGHQDDYEQLANVNPHNKPDVLFLANEQKTSAKYRALGLLIGYTYFFK